MGAACTTLTVPPETAEYINDHWGLTIKIPAAEVRHIWRHVGPYVRDMRLRLELQKILTTHRINTRYLILHVRGEQRWTFEIASAPPNRVVSVVFLGS
jgi:hypothetical protein